MTSMLQTYKFRKPPKRDFTYTIYDYDRLLDGQIRRMRPGQDFHIEPQSMAQNLRMQARFRGGFARVYQDGGKYSGCLVIQFYED